MAGTIPGLLPATLPRRTWWQWWTGRPALSYAAFVGLWLCRMEVLWQQVYAGYVGAQYANSLGDIPADMWLSVCDDEATAFECWSSTNGARSRALMERQPPGTQVQRIM